tara:strand:- start:3652 stop:4458 length:807 start_codon:yes stop_codon:yes gene_type:complete
MISSFSAVATEEVRREAAVMAFSVRQFYDSPIFFVCDEGTREYLSRLDIPHLEFSTLAEPENLSHVREEYANVAIANEFHRIDCIALKMDCLNWATKEAGDTMFVDTDIIINQPIHDDIGGEITLSPHFNYVDKVGNYKRYGVFNAGYLWTNQREAGDIWKDIYLNRSSFFEQQGMIYFLEYYDTKNFDITHNVGFWRMPLIASATQRMATLDESVIDWESVKSFHVHTFPECFVKADFGLKRVYNQHREICMAKLNNDLSDFIKRLP